MNKGQIDNLRFFGPGPLLETNQIGRVYREGQKNRNNPKKGKKGLNQENEETTIYQVKVIRSFHINLKSIMIFTVDNLSSFLPTPCKH